MSVDARAAGATARHGWTSRWVRAARWLLLAIALFALLGFFAVPPLLKHELEDSLGGYLHRDVRIVAVAFNPFTLAGTLSGISVTPKSGGAPLLAIDKLFVDFEAMSLVRWAPMVSALRVVHPQVHFVRQTNGRYNVSDIIDAAMAEPTAPPPGTPPSPPPRFSVSNIEVVDGYVDFDDLPDHRKHVISDLRLGVPFISSLPSNVAIHVEPAFSAIVNDRPVAITGETLPFADSRETTLNLDLSGIELAGYMQYVPVPLRFVLRSGALDARLVLLFATHAGKPSTFEFSGAASVRDLAITDKRSAPLLSASGLVASVGKLDISNRTLDVRGISVAGASVNLVHSANGELNLALLGPDDEAALRTPVTPPANTPPPKPFRFRIGDLKVFGAIVHVADEAVTPPLRATVSDLQLTATNLGNAPGTRACIDAAFATDGGANVMLHGSLTLDPLLFDGGLDVKVLTLARLYPYYQSALNLQVDAGTLDAAADVKATMSPSGFQLVLSNMDAVLNDLRLRLPDQREALWRIPSVTASGASVDVARRTVGLGDVHAKGAVISLRHNADGSFNFDRLIKTSAPTTAADAAVAGAAARDASGDWHVDARLAAVEDFAFTFDDMTVTPAAHFAMSRIAVDAENVSTGAGSKMHVRGKAVVNQRGSIAFTGPMTTAPFTGTLNITATGIDLVPLQPYIARSARVVMTSGVVSTQGVLDFATGDHARAAFKGSVTASDVAALDEANSTDLLKWHTLKLGGIVARSDPLAVAIDDIVLDDFYARLLLNENGEFNLQQLARDQPPPDPPKPDAKTASVGTGEATATLPARDTKSVPWLKLGKATVAAGNVYFTDHFIRPNYSANVTGLAGSMSTLTFDTPADVSLRGAVDGVAPVEIAGKLNPLAEDLFIDLKATAKDIDLSPTSPYSGKYAGYGIQKGKLSVDVHYSIDKRRLTAENRLILDQLTFGDKVASPDATKLPVQLAVALLKDRNGVIDIKLPISGSLDDPHFSIGGIVIQAIVNLIVKIVTSPFALLGSLGGGGGEQLSYVEFAPGSAVIDPAGDAKFKTLGKALTDRPALKIDITGHADPVADREGLKHATLDHKMRLERFNDLAKDGHAPASVDDVAIDAADYPKLLERVYKDEKIDKPRNAIGFAKDLPADEMERLLLASYVADDDALRQLANDRAQRAKRRLVEDEHVAGDRVFLVAPSAGTPAAKESARPSRVDFALR